MLQQFLKTLPRRMLKTTDLSPCYRSWANVRKELSIVPCTLMFHPKGTKAPFLTDWQHGFCERAYNSAGPHSPYVEQSAGCRVFGLC